MSREYPCVYYDNEKCKKFSEDGVTSFCVLGPCSHKTPSNADRVRAMTDEELAEFMAPSKTPHDGSPWCQPVGKVKCGKPSCNGCALNWLKQPCGGAE